MEPVEAQETTEMNFAGRDRGRESWGWAATATSLGFFIHLLVAVDADDEALLSVVGAKIWTSALTEDEDASPQAEPRRTRNT